jgi:hypothetical protein
LSNEIDETPFPQLKALRQAKYDARDSAELALKMLRLNRVDEDAMRSVINSQFKLAMLVEAALERLQPGEEDAG